MGTLIVMGALGIIALAMIALNEYVLGIEVHMDERLDR